jgi:hypothetical protein
MLVVGESWATTRPSAAVTLTAIAARSAGGDVAAAGEMLVRDGTIEILTDRSGHYAPGRLQTQQVLDQLESQGIIIDPINIHLIAPPET